jgi:hypothetical protein
VSWPASHTHQRIHTTPGAATVGRSCPQGQLDQLARARSATPACRPPDTPLGNRAQRTWSHTRAPTQYPHTHISSSAW